MNKVPAFLFFLFLSCHDTGPDPIDNPNPIDTMGIDTMPMDTIPMDTMPMDTMPMDTMPMDTMNLADGIAGDYHGTCYFDNKIFSFETGLTTYERDTVYNAMVPVQIDTIEQGAIRITVNNNFYFYPYVFFTTKEKFMADTIRLYSNISVYTTDLTLIRPDTSMVVDHITYDFYGPGYHKCNCHFKKK